MTAVAPLSDVARGELLTPLPPLPDGTEPPKMPVAFVSGELTSANYSDLVETKGWLVRRMCSALGFSPGSDFISWNYSNTKWANIFYGAMNDGVVPFSSSSFGGFSNIRFSGVIHGPGTGGDSLFEESLGFAGPSLTEGPSGAPLLVTQLLDTPTDDPRFLLMPSYPN